MDYSSEVIKGKKIRTLLVDDDAESRRHIRRMLSACEDFRIAGEADSKASALTLLKSSAVDVIFSDIQMEGGSGFELAESVHREHPDILVVFLTGYASFALDGYMYGPVDFLVKPVSEERLYRTLERIRERFFERKESERKPHIGIQTEERYCILNVESIAWLEKENRCVKIVTKDGDVVRTGKSMQELEEILMEYGFFRCHQSYLVPLEDIQEVQKESFGRAYRIILRGNVAEPPCSRAKYAELKETLQDKGIRRV